MQLLPSQHYRKRRFGVCALCGTTVTQWLTCEGGPVCPECVTEHGVNKAFGLAIRKARAPKANDRQPSLFLEAP